MIDADTLHERLARAAQDTDREYTGDADTVAEWLAEHPTDEYAAAARERIDGRTVTLDDDVNGNTLREIITAHNDDPDEFAAGYVIEAGRTIVQYRHRSAEGKPPIDPDDAADALAAHVDDLVKNAVWGQVLPDARERFLTDA